MAQEVHPEYPIASSYNLGEEWAFDFDSGEPAVPGIHSVCVNKQTGEMELVPVPPLENLDRIEEGKRLSKIIEAEIMSEGKTKLRIMLTSGEIIEGYSLGKKPAVDEAGEELDYDVIVLETEKAKKYFVLKDEDIASTERIENSIR